MRKQFIRLVSNLFPSQVVDFAYNQLSNPQVRKLREKEMEVLETAAKERIDFLGFEIQTYSWTKGGKAILLIHGWEGQAGNFAKIIQALVKNGYTVYAFDAPSHGFSSKGETSLFEFTQLVGELIQKYRVKDLISHSFGGVATTFALTNHPHVEIDNYLLITTPDKFSQRLDEVAEFTGINEKVKKMLIDKIRRETQLEPLELNVSNFVKNIQVKRALIIHDKNDRVIPLAQSLHVHQNWPASELVQIEGTGHYRILLSDEVIDRTLEFFG